MSLSEMVGVFGFFLALGHISWQIWFQHRQNTERVKASVYLPGSACVRVVNTGVIPVHVAGVELVVAERKVPLQAIVSRRALPMSAGELGKEQWQLIGRPSYTEPLQRGGEQVFVLPSEAAPTEEEVSKVPPGQVCIVVRSNVTEIYRLKGQSVLDLLNAVRGETSRIRSRVEGDKRTEG